MAVEALGKSLDQLKKERTVAKSCFTKQTNYLSTNASTLTESELRGEFGKLSVDARKLIKANDEYRAGLEAELESKAEEGEEGMLDKEQDANLKKVTTDCEQRLKEVKATVQTNLWGRYGHDALEAALQEAEKACMYIYTIPVESRNCEGYEVRLSVLDKLVKGAHKVISD